MAAADYYSVVQKAYIAFYGRPADQVGLEYWASQLNAANGNLATIINSFGTSTEALTLYGSQSDLEAIEAVYLQIFGRSADVEGLKFYGSELAAGRMTLVDIAQRVADGATGDDATIISNKLVAAQAFTDSMDTSAEILSYVGTSAAATARTWLSAVGSDTASVTAATDTISTTISGLVSSGSTGTTGSTFTLTTNVDGISGTSNNDTISGTIGVSGTYNAGDNIVGGAGNDTLNIIDAGSATSVGLVSLDAVEVVNVRTVTAGTTIVNANDWDGVTTLSNASSNAGATLQASGVALTTEIAVHGNTDVNVAFGNQTTATEAVSVALVSVGNDTTATTLASASAAATANVSLDMASADLLTAVNIDVSGAKNIARLDAGSAVTSYTVTGTGNAILVTDDTITSFNASAAAGNLDVSFSGASTLAVVGGAGNDTFRFGTTYNNGDTVNGGAGTNTVALTMAGFNRELSTTNVQTATVTFADAAGGTLNASASTVATFALAAGTADNAASISQMANATTVTLNDDSLGNVTLDYVSGASTTTLNLGSASGTVTLGTLAITDVANVTINSVGVSGAVGGTITTATFDSDLKSLAITTSGGEADLTIGNGNVDMSLGGATSLTVTSNGSAAITFNAVDLAGTALANVIVSANGTDAANVTLGDVSGSAITLVSLTANSGADIIVGTLDLGNNHTATEQNQVLTIVQGDTADVTVGAITVSGVGTTTINVTQNGVSAVADIAAITLDRIAGVTADSGPLNLTFGDTTVGSAGVVSINNIDLTAAGTGAQLALGTITIGRDGGWSAGTVSGTAAVNVDLADVAINVGASATATLGAITVTAGAVGAISVTLSSDATATFGTVAASAVGTHTIVANTGASANFGDISTFSGGNANEGSVGAIEISGVSGADVQFGAINASAVGAIGVSGALDVTIGTITTTTMGTVDATNLNKSGAFTIDLSGVTNAVEVNLGAGTNTIISGAGNDVITLLAGSTGNDNIEFTSAGEATDSIIGFFAGSTGGDKILLQATGLALTDGGETEVATGDTVGLVLVTAADTTTTLADGDNVIVFGSAFASTAELMAAIGTGGTQELSLDAAATAGGALLVVWGDGTDSYISTIAFAIADEAIATGAAVTTLAVLSGVTPGALVAANFEFV